MQTTLDPTTQRRLDEAQREQERVASERASQERIEAWNRKMTRAFKGIMSAPERRAMLNRAAERS